MQPNNFFTFAAENPTTYFYRNNNFNILKRSNYDKEKYFKTAAGIADVLLSRVLYGL